MSSRYFKSSSGFVRQLFVGFVGVLFWSVCTEPVFADIYYDLSAGYSQGNFSAGQTFPISGPLTGMDAGYYAQFSDGMHFTIGGAGRYSVLSHTPDGIKKSGNFYQMGASAGVQLFLGDSVHLQIRGHFWNYSKFYVFSDVKSSVNSEDYRTQSFTLYDGGNGTEGTIGIFSQSKRKGRSSTVRYGISAGYENQAFTAKSERVVITRPNVAKSDATTNSAGAFAMTLLNAEISVGLVF